MSIEFQPGFIASTLSYFLKMENMKLEKEAAKRKK